jgi:hypothetical protein
MKRLSIAYGIALAVALAGCQGSNKQAAEEPASAGHPAGEQAATETAPAGGAEVVTLTGNVGCGHCNFGKTSECSSAIQTADGTVTVIDGVSLDSELWKLREENMKPAEVTGTIAQGPDGLQHIQMASFKIL